MNLSYKESKNQNLKKKTFVFSTGGWGGGGGGSGWSEGGLE